MADILEGLLESGSAVQSPVLAILAEAGQGKKKRKAVNPQPRRRDVHMHRVLRDGAFQCQATLGRN